MFKIYTISQISGKGLERFSKKRYEVGDEVPDPDAILVRGHKIAPKDLNPSLKVIARAGTSVEKIPVPLCTEKGIPIFNTPGANANAVKELVLAALILSSRGVVEGAEFAQKLAKVSRDPKVLNQKIERERRKFYGQEIAGKTLGVIGLGAVGSLVAEMAIHLGMNVLGYDPTISVDAAWKLSNQIDRIEDLTEILSRSDYITLHLPLDNSTTKLINQSNLDAFKLGSHLINFSREQVIDHEDLIEVLDERRISKYITDFPHPKLMNRNDIILLPHIAASTFEAEDNCALMAVEQVKDFLENGNIKNSINFPDTYLERSRGVRLSIANRNIPRILGKILGVLAEHNVNIIDMINKSRNKVGYTLIDVEAIHDQNIIQSFMKIEGLLFARVL